MKPKLLIIVVLSISLGIGQCFGDEEVSAFYTLPVGAFVGTVSNQGIVHLDSSAVYLPYSSVGHTWTSIDAHAMSSSWTIDNKILTPGNSYTKTSDMNSKYSTPLLQESPKVSYQFGGRTKNEFNPDAQTHVGDSVSHFMTPAKLVCDIVQAGESSPTLLIISTSYRSQTHDTIGLYFNNIDVMYIDSIRIPITSNKTEKTVNEMFPNANSHVKVTIYPAKTIGGKDKNTADHSKKLAELTLGKSNFTANNLSSNTGTIQAALSSPISITGPFVVELTEMKSSGCDFYVYVTKEREGFQDWGYYVEGDGREIYHNLCTPAICVNAMFPALYAKTVEGTDIVFPAEGTGEAERLRGGEATADFQRTIYANKRYRTTTGDFSDNANTIDWCHIEAISTTKNSVTFAFSADANTTGVLREADWTLSYRGKTITYHLFQPSIGQTEVRSGLQSGNFGTLCLPQNASTFTGATLWEIAYRTNTDIILEESQTLTAGTPYIYQATSDKIEVIFGEGTVIEAGSKNGLHGTLTPISISTGDYILYNNELVKCGTGCSIDANRAYLVLDEVPTTPTPAPAGIRRIAMGYPPGSTALDNISEGGYGKTTKFIHNGRMYIQVNQQLFQVDGQKIR